MTIGETLKEKRTENQLTQEQLSEKIFVSRKTISNWETGKTTPDIDSLIRLADLFNLSLDNLLLEGSDIVENIKKIEAAKSANKYFSYSWLINIIFILIIGIRRIYGEQSTIVFILLTLVIILNSFVMFYFSKQVKLTNENQSPYEVLKKKNRWLLIPIILIFALLIWITFIAK